jgi:hypothetical protein
VKPQPNRTMTDLRAKLRLGGKYEEDAIKEVVDLWVREDFHVGRTAEALGVSQDTFERARRSHPALSKAMAQAKMDRDVFKA